MADIDKLRQLVGQHYHLIQHYKNEMKVVAKLTDRQVTLFDMPAADIEFWIDFISRLSEREQCDELDSQDMSER